MFYFTILFSCNSYSPFLNRKEKTESLKFLIKNIKLTREELNTMKNKDSLIYEMYTSIKSSVDSKLIRRRLDSFLLNNYSRKEFLLSLKNDRVDTDWEIDRRKGEYNHLKIKDIEELKMVIKKLDSSFNKKHEIIIVKDSL